MSTVDEEKKQSGIDKDDKSVEEVSEIGVRINARRVGKRENKAEQTQVTQGDVSFEDELIEELGKKYHVPYRLVKEATIKTTKEDLKSFGDAAALQYKLLTHDAILKASVNYVTATITVIYNPRGARNLRPKTDLDELLSELHANGIKTQSVSDRDYDYYKEFYSYAFNPPKIRDRPPYGFDAKKWDKIKDEYEKERQKHEQEKLEKFKQWQKDYYNKHKQILDKYPGDLRA